MNASPLKIESIVIAAHPKVPRAEQLAPLVAYYLEESGIEAFQSSLYDERLRERVKNKEFDLMIALGGDGTMLRAGHLCAPIGLPIFGINLGRFGFLIDVEGAQWRQALSQLLVGSYRIETRMILCAEHWQNNERNRCWDVINEVFVGRGSSVRPVHLITYVDDRYLTTYVADGLIAATPTGSTAYALAVGGPILPPDLRNILLVPVAPHLSIDRAIVLAEGATVSITVESDHQAVMSVDGQTPVELKNGDRVHVRVNDYPVKFIRVQDPGYFYRNLTPHMKQNPSTNKAL